MKKTLLSVLAGITVIGSAAALPTPEDLKKLCEKRPDTMVWVEPNKQSEKGNCIHKNPCKEGSQKEKEVYCVSVFAGILDGINKEVIEKYIKEVRGENVGSIDFLERREDYSSGFTYKYYTVKTSEKSYLVFQFLDTEGRKDSNLEDYEMISRAACWAYGGEHGTQDGSWEYSCGGVSSEERCKDIADFANLLSGGEPSYDYEYDNTKQVCKLRDEG